MSRFCERSWAVFTLLFAVVAIGTASPVHANESPDDTPYHGTWTGEFAPPAGHPILVTLIIDQRSEHDVRAAVHSTIVNTRFDGSVDPHTGRLLLKGYIGNDLVDLQLEMDGETLTGTAADPPRQIRITAMRASDGAYVPDIVVFDGSRPTPHTIHLDGLSKQDSDWLQARTLQLCSEIGIVGMSVGIVQDGEVIDLRSFGWEDYGNRIEASDRTMYRWASVAKSLTAISVMQLVEQGKLDLDADIRTLLPEFPEKPWPITAEQLLLHHAGIVHYQTGRIKQPVIAYDTAHPYEDAVVAMDLFKESDLLFEPGTRYGYTTPGYVVLGALTQKAAGMPFHEFAQDGVCRPLGMKTMQPDFKSVAIPNRTRGYAHLPDGRIVDSGDSDVSWKLAAGGWTSSIGDFARYAAGVGSTELLSSTSWQQMWTPQNPSNGETSTYGYGFGIGEINGEQTVSHSGGQRKCSSFMLCVPERRLAVVIMCNTERLPVARLAREIADRLLAGE